MTTSLIKEIGMIDSRGYVKGTVVTLGGGLLTMYLVKWLGVWLLNPLAGKLLAFITFLAWILYFGVNGFWQIPVGLRAIGLWLGERVDGLIFLEGWIWNWPKPFGGIVIADTRDKPLEIPLTEVLTADNVPVDVDTALQTQISDVNKYFNAKNPEESLTNAIISDIRASISHYQSDTVAQEKEAISDALKNGKGADGSPLERILLQAIIGSPDEWGITVTKVRVQRIRIPKELEEARTRVKVAEASQQRETAEGIAELTEAKNVATQMEVYIKAGVLPAQAAVMAQSERGKATRVVIDGNAKPIEQAGALAGGLLNNANPSQSQPPSADPNANSKRKRRRNNS